MASIEISVDLGSKFITIYQKGIGLVLREPAIAIATKNRNKFEIMSRQLPTCIQQFLICKQYGCGSIPHAKNNAIIRIRNG